MLRRAVVIVAVLAALVGCSPAPTLVDEPEIVAAGTEQLRLLEVGGLSRSYLVSAPVDARSPMPLLIMLHGAGGYAAKAEAATGFTDASIANEFVVAYPNGTSANATQGALAWNAGGCCGTPRDENIDDVSFILAMIADLEASYPVDPERIYLAGFSNGGMMSYRLACEHAELFAGIAVISGSLLIPQCEPAVPVSVLIVHGTADAVVPYTGGETTKTAASRYGQWMNTSVEFATKFWTEHDNCDADAVVDTTDIVTTTSYVDCESGSELELVTIAEGDHTWPLVDTLGVDGSQLILTFFALN
jgi:polyhydroxybutyrate depolymerase